MRVSYKERIPVIAETLRRLDRPATVAELHEELKTDSRFATPRRIAATFRYDKRVNADNSVLIRVGRDRIGLRNPARMLHAEPGPQESRVYERGQTVVPKAIRDAMAVEEGTKLVWEYEQGVTKVVAIPKDPVAAARGMLKGKGPTFQEFLADRQAERERERQLEEDEERRWRTYSTRQQ